MSGAPALAPTRRALLLGASRLALAVAAGGLAACSTPDEPEPWSDGTWFADGTGWVER